MSIDSCYEDIIEKLTKKGTIKEVSLKLLASKTNAERAVYVYDIISSLNAFPKALEITKTEEVSTFYRNQGNHLFQHKEDYLAWQYYNLALLRAPIASDCYFLALANRSAVLFSLRKFKESLHDIEEVLSSEHLEKLKDKLKKREFACKEFLLKYKDEISTTENPGINEILTMTGPTDPRFPCASTKLEVVFNKEMGRHVIAKEDIKVGEVLVNELPYFTLLLKSQYLFSCSYCLSRNVNLIPCDKCCFSLYCNQLCKENAWKDCHSVECSLMATLVEMKFTKLELLALRTVIKARSDHSSWDALFKTIEDAESNYDSEYRGHIKVNDKWVYDSKYYPSIHTLASNIEKRSVSDIFQKAVTAAVFLDLLSNNTDFVKAENKLQKEKIHNCVAGSLLLHIMTSPTNMHGISTNVETAEGNFVEEMSLASAPYAFHSLLNHSCAPNVVRYSKLGTGEMKLLALRPIKKGMQLYDNYGAHHALQDRQTRHENLKFQYKFVCLCEACVEDWPSYLKMKPSKNLTKDILKQKEDLLFPGAIDKLQKGDIDTALKMFKPLCDLIEVLDPYAPSVELADCQEALKQCMSILGGLVTYGFSQVIDWDALPSKLSSNSN